MAEDTSGAGAAVGGTTVVIPGEMAARVDRLPMSRMAWEIALIVQVGWACSASTDGIARGCTRSSGCRANVITHSQYDVLYALEAGISILIGGYALGWLADKIGRRTALILSSVLAGVFIWPFAYVTNYPALFVLSIADTLGFAGYLAINVVYMSEIMGPSGPAARSSWPAGRSCIFLLFVVLSGIIPHYWFPGQYRAVPVAAGRAEHRGGARAVLPDAGVAALAGGPGAPRQGAPGRRADGGAGQQARPRACPSPT